LAKSQVDPESPERAQSPEPRAQSPEPRAQRAQRIVGGAISAV
jgi:hypothetical protein